ncbi:ATP-dependent DNA helicase [Mycena sanguinolenta]|uniref:ATP-dependent DNA helicase n=1 Tax=Mycena sanguinolenta TaxID=230812 RepID=A0A8H7CF78_9AGAR|nr:ATP-dependent DNA helicase [Mycena sanguinolenta]
MSSPMAPLASFCNVPISVVFDSNAAISSISLDWVMNSRLRTHDSRVSGLLTLPSNTGILSAALSSLSVASSLPCDLVLGLDWFQFVRNSASDTNIIVYLGSGPLEIRRHPLAAFGREPELSCHAASSSSSPMPVLRGGIGVDASPSSSFLVSWGGPRIVSTPSSTPRTRGGDAVAACTLADPFTPPPSRTRDVINMNNDMNFDVEPPMNIRERSVASRDDRDPFVQMTLQEKKAVVCFLVRDQHVALPILRKMATRHQNMSPRGSGGTWKGADTLRTEFLDHQCIEACLILKSEALAAGLNAVSVVPDELQDRLSASKKRKAPSLPANSRKLPRLSLDTPADDVEFPILLPQSEKDQIVREFREATSNVALKRYECSFCGKFESAIHTTLRLANDLDISLLTKAVMELRTISRQPRIEVFNPQSIINGRYVLCHLCNSAINKNGFSSIPLRSYANGLWIGKVPEELQDLTFLEEQCIARARATKCMYKLNMGPTGQLAARGNVCILPQDTASLITAMPVPLFRLRDEICVILVGSPDVEVTHDMLKKTPLLVRREKIRKALFWLIDHNPLYADLDKNTIIENLEEYPEYDCPLAVTDFLRTNSANNQGSSYTSYSDQANTELFENSATFELTSTSLVDVDSMDSTYQQRKLEALRKLKKQEAGFVKFPSGNTPLSTSKNPRVFGLLWPTLFPYGVGMIDNNNIRISPDIPFHQVDTLPHVQHLLSIADRRFQIHKSFIFVISNIIQRRKSSFKSRLATNRSWFPIVQELMQKIDTQSMESYQAKLEENSFAKAETPGEKAAAQVLKYISYVSDHIPGSVGDVNSMKQQMHSKIICEGLPHIFATVNPAESHNPIAQVLAGRDIDLDKIFHALGEGTKEGSIRAKTLAENPVAGAEFFHLMITKFLEIILGTKRSSKIGILGKVKGWYAVVEAQVRGSLHIHLLIWIDGAPASPLDMKELMNSDPEFKQKLTAWYDDIICQSFPRNTIPYAPADGTPKQLPVLSRPLDPDSEDYEHRRDQHHRDLCENTGLVHGHNATCFKHIPRRIQSLVDPDTDCRFHLPRPLVAETHFDDDDDLMIRCENGHLNGHNSTATLCLGCNTDLKQTASGSTAMAMVEYMCNYTVKLQLDTSVVFSALCASIKALQEKPPEDIDGQIDNSEMARLMMVKTTNTLVGKRELTGQQTASFLLGRKNNYTSDEYEEYWWSSMLRDLARDIFVVELESESTTETSDEDVAVTNDESQTHRMVIPEDEDDGMVLLTTQNLDQEQQAETDRPSLNSCAVGILCDIL